MRCPHCQNKLLQKSEAGTRLRISGAVSIDDANVLHAQCFWCGHDVTIPGVEMKKALPDEAVERFTIPAKKRA